VTYRDICRRQLPLDECVGGRPNKRAYRDSKGIWTAGVGHNLQACVFSDAVIELWFTEDLEEAERAARVLFPSFDALSEARKAVLLNMAFNMGQDRFAGFGRMRGAVAAGDFMEAARQMRDSKWYREDVQKSRSERLIAMMEQG